MKKSDSDDAQAWRRRYQDGVAALDRAERRLTEVEAQLYASVTRLALGVHGLDAALDERLDPLLAAVRERRDPQAIAALAFAIQEAGRERDASPAASPTADPPPEIAEGLAELVAALPLSEPLRVRAEAVRGRLGALAPAAAIGAIAELAAALCEEIDRERAEMRRYLELLDERLRGLGTVLSEQAAESLAETRIRRLIDEGFGREVAGMRRAVLDAVGVEPLRRAVSERIAALEAGMSELLAAEAERRARIELAARRTSERLAQIESESAQLNERLDAVSAAAHRDALTGCYNRAAFDEHLAEEHARWLREPAPLSLAIGDLDRFKSINDTHGHPVGDKVLRAVGSILQRGVRGSDFLARYGGEEFVLLLPATALEGAARLADALRGRVARRRFLHEGRRIAMSMSFGVAQIAPGETPDEVLARADRALYVAKAAGRNRVRTAAA